MTVKAFIIRIIFFKEFSRMLKKKKVPWAANQHNRMISEGSCDTKTGVLAAENSALPGIKLYF